jgi:hypothetical protein
MDIEDAVTGQCNGLVNGAFTPELRARLEALLEKQSLISAIELFKDFNWTISSMSFLPLDPMNLGRVIINQAKKIDS